MHAEMWGDAFLRSMTLQRKSRLARAYRKEERNKGRHQAARLIDEAAAGGRAAVTRQPRVAGKAVVICQLRPGENVHLQQVSGAES